MAENRVDGFIAIASSLTLSRRAVLADLAQKHRLPGVFGAKDNVVAGGLMSYAPDARDLTRRAASYIDKILKGQRPADLPSRLCASASIWRAMATPSSAMPVRSGWRASSRSDGMPVTGQALAQDQEPELRTLGYPPVPL